VFDLIVYFCSIMFLGDMVTNVHLYMDIQFYN
jgi:hypothetical protein